MTDTVTLNYPDVLGEISKNQRFEIGDQIQAAIAIQPLVVSAGRPFYAILLLQNMTDVAVDVAATFRLPDADSKKKHFSALVDRAVVTIKPAEVGYIRYPINTHIDTPQKDNYKLTVQFATRLIDITAKPLPVRDETGGSKLHYDDLSEQRVKEYERLKRLNYSVERGGGILRKNIIEKSVRVVPGKDSETTDRKPFWKSIWTSADFGRGAELGLLRKYAQDIESQVIKKLIRAALFEPLVEKIDEGFKAGGFALTEFEKRMATRPLMGVLQYMAPDASDKFRAEKLLMPHLSVMDIIAREDFADGEFEVNLPNWLFTLLRIAENEKKALQYANRAIIFYCYDDLVRDAVLLSFAMIEHALKEDLGSRDDMIEYGEHLIKALHGEGMMDYSLAYMPLILGGALMCDLVLMQDEKTRHILDDLPLLIDERKGTISEEHQSMFEMTERVVKLMRVKYGYPVDL